jgi:hypothetical protein
VRHRTANNVDNFTKSIIERAVVVVVVLFVPSFETNVDANDASDTTAGKSSTQLPPFFFFFLFFFCLFVYFLSLSLVIYLTQRQQTPQPSPFPVSALCVFFPIVFSNNRFIAFLLLDAVSDSVPRAFTVALLFCFVLFCFFVELYFANFSSCFAIANQNWKRNYARRRRSRRRDQRRCRPPVIPQLPFVSAFVDFVFFFPCCRTATLAPTPPPTNRPTPVRASPSSSLHSILFNNNNNKRIRSPIAPAEKLYSQFVPSFPRRDRRRDRRRRRRRRQRPARRTVSANVRERVRECVRAALSDTRRPCRRSKSSVN